jgi:hypothetical protein
MLNFEKLLGEDPQTPLSQPQTPTFSKSCQTPLSQPRTPHLFKILYPPLEYIHHNNTLIEYWESKILGKLFKQPGVLNKYCKLVNVLVHYVLY